MGLLVAQHSPGTGLDGAPSAQGKAHPSPHGSPTERGGWVMG